MLHSIFWAYNNFNPWVNLCRALKNPGQALRHFRVPRVGLPCRRGQENLENESCLVVWSSWCPERRRSPCLHPGRRCGDRNGTISPTVPETTAIKWPCWIEIWCTSDPAINTKCGCKRWCKGCTSGVSAQLLLAGQMTLTHVRPSEGGK